PRVKATREEEGRLSRVAPLFDGQVERLPCFFQVLIQLTAGARMEVVLNSEVLPLLHLPPGHGEYSSRPQHPDFLEEGPVALEAAKGEYLEDCVQVEITAPVVTGEQGSHLGGEDDAVVRLEEVKGQGPVMVRDKEKLPGAGVVNRDGIPAIQPQ